MEPTFSIIAPIYKRNAVWMNSTAEIIEVMDQTH